MEDRSLRLRRLITPVHDQALGFARCLCRSRADGDDLFQESLLRAMDKLDDLRDDAAFKRWLYRVIISVHRNRAGGFWRRLVQLGRGDEEHGATEWAQARPTADEVDAADRARQALAALSAEQREAIVLFEIEGWQVDEIAAVHGITASAVKSRLARGRERMRAFYERRLAAASRALVPGEVP
ncbi:MAG TPA: RNA polymerase sigma factor [Kofleriaceae bacterium]|nr:RNA polymerase sigma factor [Kofleriaceae bacterium]